MSLILHFRVFHMFRILEYSVYSAIPLNGVTPDILMSKKKLNAGLISGVCGGGALRDDTKNGCVAD